MPVSWNRHEGEVCGREAWILQARFRSTMGRKRKMPDHFVAVFRVEWLVGTLRIDSTEPIAKCPTMVPSTWPN